MGTADGDSRWGQPMEPMGTDGTFLKAIWDRAQLGALSHGESAIVPSVPEFPSPEFPNE
jgi:hypothetical protein